MPRENPCSTPPKPRIDKLGLKAGHRYALAGAFGEDFLAEAYQRASEPATSPPLDCIFVRLDATDELSRLIECRTKLEDTGMIWAVWPKGRKELREDDIRRFALDHGLVDVKVMSFSETLSGLKLVIPLAARGKV